MPDYMGDEHRRGILHVIASRMPVGVKSERRAVIEVKTLTTPRHEVGTLGHPYSTSLVDTHGDTGLGRRDGIGQRFPFIGQQATYLVYKRFMQIHRCKVS